MYKVNYDGEGSRKKHKKTRHMPRKCANYSLTKTVWHDTMIIHTVILCLLMDFTSDKAILPQYEAAVKHELVKI